MPKGLDIEYWLWPTHMPSDLVLFNLSPLICSNNFNNPKTSRPDCISVNEHAKSSAPRCIALMLLLDLIAMANNFIQMIKRYGDNGSPCLTPLPT